MKYTIRQFSTLFYVCFLVFTIISCTNSGSNEQKNTKKLASQNDLPKLSLTTTEGEHRSIEGDYQGKTIVVLFQPDCDDCQREARQIEQNIGVFDDYDLYFVSSAPMAQISDFAVNFKLDNYENVVFAQTTVQDVIKQLGQIPAPSIYIYSEEGKLVKAFNGEVGIDEIKPFL